MSTISAGPSSAATVPAKAMISVRRGSLAAFAAAGLLVAMGAGLLLATSDHLVDPIAFGLQVAVTVVGWFSAALYWLVRRPGNRLGLFLLALAVATGRDLASGSDPAAAPQHRCVGRFGLLSSRVLRHLRVPGGSHCESLRMGAARRDVARNTGVVRPLAPLLAGRPWPCSACRLQRCVSRERLHDRRSADARRRFLQQGHHGVLPVRGLLRNLRLPDLPAGDGDAAAEAGTPACLRPGSDVHRSGPGLLRSRRRAGARGCGPALGGGAGWPPSVTAQCHTDFCFRSW